MKSIFDQNIFDFATHSPPMTNTWSLTLLYTVYGNRTAFWPHISIWIHPCGLTYEHDFGWRMPFNSNQKVKENFFYYFAFSLLIFQMVFQPLIQLRVRRYL